MATAIVKQAAAPILHGGDLGAVRRHFPQAPEPWLDLSTGINPIAYPLGAIAAEAWSRLPSRADEEALRTVAAKRLGVRDPAMIVAAPGTQALIQLLPRLMAKARVAIVGLTYGEHEASWRRQGHDVTVVEEFARTDGYDVTVIVNPDNPTGRLLSATELRASNATLVVDEAFIDFLPTSASLARDLPSNAIVLRSFGKAYGLAGLRLGFAIAKPDLAARLREELGPWAVSGPALAIGTTALADTTWLRSTAARLKDDGARLDTLLTKAGFVLLGGTPLFRLAQHEEAVKIVERLGQLGIHVRAFSHQPRWLRFGLPGSDTEFRRLGTALGI
jgi:cobalamin biosynthetic protein CobC